MTKPLIQIGDDVREMTDAEHKQHLADMAEETARRKTEQNHATNRASALTKLSALGLTDQEIAALLP
jgi:DNA-binding NarL/FixJ family response regulator